MSRTTGRRTTPGHGDPLSTAPAAVAARAHSGPVASASAGDQRLGSRYAAPQASPGFVLWQVATLWQREIRSALDALDLTHAQFTLLAGTAWLLGRATAGGAGDAAQPVITQADVAAHVRTDPVMTSEVLRTLERKGWLRRRPHPTDGRAWRLEVTPAGRALVRRAIARVEAVDAAFFGTPGPELQALARLLATPATSDTAVR